MEEDFTPDFLGGESVAEVPVAEATPAAPAAPETAPAAEAAPAAAEPQSEPNGPARGPDGKFVATAEPVAAAPAAAQPVAEPVAQPEAQHIPLAAHLDERERRQAAERQRDELQARIDADERQRQQQAREAAVKAAPVQIPDPATDPQGFAAFQQQQMEDRLFFQRRDDSRRFAVLEHGKDVTDAAFQWGAARCDTDPSFNARVRASQYPMDLVVNEWRQAQAVEKFGSIDPKDYDAFTAWKATQPGAQQPGASQQQQTHAAAPPGAAPAAPRPSLAAAPSAGAASEPRGEDGDEVFDGMFRRK